ncbi:MAG TPA: tetratricopeptide repeat protein [Burkholderiaceae bacterium]|nr:tetratricopeptide repeat protein [Burkholderiaceae bacterium]
MRTARRSTLVRWVSIGLAAALASGCLEPKRELVPVPIPDSTGLEPSVRSALERARAQFDRVAGSKPKPAELADAYGELAMTYQAQSLVPPAEAAYANARALAPGDKRWPYLLGHLYNDASRVPEAIVALEAARAIDGKDSPTLLSLGEVYLQHGELDKAQTMYQRLESDDKARAAALTGLGKVALARHQYKEAVQYLEEALRLSPGSTRLRQPLAMAYMGLGDRAKAEENLRQYSVDGMEPGVVDPLADALEAKVAASRTLVRRGKRFGKAGRFDLAEAAFRAAVEADPTSADALANLGISLANLGRIDEAQRRLSESLAIDDTSAVAHFSLGVILDRQGLDRPAMDQYRAALDRDPSNVQARVYLADAKMRVGRADEAGVLYGQALKQSPDSLRMQLSLAMANVKAGHYGEARNDLELALKAHPGNPEITNALARILATAPESMVRDGPRALALAKALFESTRDPDVGQTYAMAMAETGGFEQAVVLQKETIIVFEHTGGQGKKPFLQKNLARYEQRKPTREGWAADDPVFQPRSPAARLAKASS